MKMLKFKTLSLHTNMFYLWSFYRLLKFPTYLWEWSFVARMVSWLAGSSAYYPQFHIHLYFQHLGDRGRRIRSSMLYLATQLAPWNSSQQKKSFQFSYHVWLPFQYSYHIIHGMYWGIICENHIISMRLNIDLKQNYTINEPECPSHGNIKICFHHDMNLTMGLIV